MSRIRVMIADDHAGLRRGVRRLLETELGIEVVAEAKSFGEAMRLILQHQPDVAIVDISMPGPKNFRRADFAAVGERSKCIVLVMSIWVDEEAEEYAASLGAAARVDKVRLHDTLIPMIFSLIAAKSCEQNRAAAVS